MWDSSQENLSGVMIQLWGVEKSSDEVVHVNQIYILEILHILLLICNWYPSSTHIYSRWTAEVA